MQTNLYQLYNRKLNGLTVFRALLEDVLIQRLQKLLRACEESDAETLTCTSGAFTSALFEKNAMPQSENWISLRSWQGFPQRQ